MELIWTGEQDKGYPQTQRYNLEAQRAIDQARQETLRRGAKLVSVADLLAGLTWEEGTRADRIASLKENALYLRWLVSAPQLPARHVPAEPAQPGLEHGVRIALAYAWAEADRDGEKCIGTDHLLRGLLRFPNVAHFALLKTDVRLQQARVASKLDREELFSEDAPKLLVVQYRVRKYFAQWAPSLLGIGCYLYVLIQDMSTSRFPLAK